MQAIIMAGGKGSRLMPLTEYVPKPMMPIIDRPIIDYVIENLVKNGIDDIIITLGYKGEFIKNYCSTGKKWGAKIRYNVEKKPLGTAGSVKACKSMLIGDFVVISGDAFCDIDIVDMCKKHYESGALLTLACNFCEDARPFGLVKLNDSMQVVDFEEKPKTLKSGFVNMGIYVAKYELLAHIPQGKCDFSYDVFPYIKSQMNCYLNTRYWSDIGTLSSYYLTNNYVATNLLKV